MNVFVETVRGEIVNVFVPHANPTLRHLKEAICHEEGVHSSISYFLLALLFSINAGILSSHIPRNSLRGFEQEALGLWRGCRPNRENGVEAELFCHLEGVWAMASQFSL
jgi:hypothetical protein